MGNTIILSILEKDKLVRKELAECISMSFMKERYTPFSTFKGTFVVADDIGEIVDVEVRIDNLLIHKGLVDISEIKQLPSHRQVTISSRGYTFALGYNEIEAGLQYDLNLEGILTQKDILPNISYETPTKIVGYLYVKTHSSIWDSVVNLCLKSENDYPYIAYPNMIRFTKHLNPKVLNFSSMDNVIALSDGNDLSKVISHINMKDLSDSYDTYHEASQFALDRNIIRHRYIDLDKQWLANNNQGLIYRLNYGMRGGIFNSITYKGFNGEDLNDRFCISVVGFEKPEQYISKVEIFGSKKGLYTKLTAYKDAYCNNV